jgi:hypothetical protein
LTIETESHDCTSLCAVRLGERVLFSLLTTFIARAFNPGIDPAFEVARFDSASLKTDERRPGDVSQDSDPFRSRVTPELMKRLHRPSVDKRRPGSFEFMGVSLFFEDTELIPGSRPSGIPCYQLSGSLDNAKSLTSAVTRNEFDPRFRRTSPGWRRRTADLAQYAEAFEFGERTF